MLLNTPSHMHDRFTLTSTEAREEARSIKPDKAEAWKRRRKKTDRQMLSVASGTTGPSDRYYRPAALPPYATTSNRRHQRKPNALCHRRYYRPRIRYYRATALPPPATATNRRLQRKSQDDKRYYRARKR